MAAHLFTSHVEVLAHAKAAIEAGQWHDSAVSMTYEVLIVPTAGLHEEPFVLEVTVTREGIFDLSGPMVTRSLAEWARDAATLAAQLEELRAKLAG